MQYTSRQVYEYISKQTNDPIVQRKTCTISGQVFPIYQSDIDFYNKISPTFNGVKYQIPTPTLCPEERQRRRLSFRNERGFYRRRCFSCNCNFLSIYNPNTKLKILCNECWSNDDIRYGIFDEANKLEFDFAKTFGQNIYDLYISLPIKGMIKNTDAKEHNIEYTNYVYNSKNAYLCFNSAHMQDVGYVLGSSRINNSLDLLDCRGGGEKFIEHAYDCYKCAYSYYIFNCNQVIDSSYCYYCTNCQNCNYALGCVDMIGQKQSYFILNKKSTKEEFEDYLYKINNDPDFKKQFLLEYQKLLDKRILCGCINHNSENCIGNEVNNCKNVILCDDIPGGSNDCKYCAHRSNGTNNARDCSVTGASENIYESLDMMRNYNTFFSLRCWDGDSIIYSIDCMQNCKNLFGCIGLRNKQYCIFNKQYTEAEYNQKIVQIIQKMSEDGEWGEFFHPSLSPFGYNETVANEYFPCISEDNKIIQKIDKDNIYKNSSQNLPTNLHIFGYKRSDYSSDPKIPEGVKTYCKKDYDDLSWNDLVNDDNIVKYIIVCEVSGRPFMIQKMELEFYRKHNLAIPSRHPDIRHEERMKLRPGRILYLRNCDCCGEEMLSVYDKNYEGKVYCEKCYQKEVYR